MITQERHLKVTGHQRLSVALPQPVDLPISPLAPDYSQQLESSSLWPRPFSLNWRNLLCQPEHQASAESSGWHSTTKNRKQIHTSGEFILKPMLTLIFLKDSPQDKAPATYHGSYLITFISCIVFPESPPARWPVLPSSPKQTICSKILVLGSAGKTYIF